MPTEIRLDDLSSWVGHTFGPTAPLTVTQAMIDRFAELTVDRQWVHVDVERAGREMGGTIAHGYLILSLVPQFTAQLLVITGVGHGLNYGLNRVRFTSAVLAAAEIVATQTITKVENKSGGILFTSEVAIAVVGGERPACVAETLVLVYPGEGRLE